MAKGFEKEVRLAKLFLKAVLFVFLSLYKFKFKKMKNILRNVLAVVCGIIVGGVLNMGIIMVSSSIIPPPDGADLKTMEGLKEAMHLMQPKHFILPFLAHALGTFAGSLIAAVIVSKHKLKFALGIGAWFMIGGIMNIVMLPSPIWFTVVDLVGAYIPMGFVAGKLLEIKQQQQGAA